MSDRMDEENKDILDKEEEKDSEQKEAETDLTEGHPDASSTQKAGKSDNSEYEDV